MEKETFFNQKRVTKMLSEKEIRKRVEELGKEITADYKDCGDDLILLGILKGSFVFLADIARAVDLPLTVDFIGVSSYGDSTKSSGVVKLTKDLSDPIEGKHVLIVEDIVDTGLTMKYLQENLATRKPASVKICSLLEKPMNNKIGIKVDYLGFTIPDRFVIGYGLDYAEKYRNLPYVGVMEKG